MARLLLLFLLLALAGCQSDLRDYEPGWDELNVTRSSSELELRANYRDEQRDGATTSDGLQELEFRETYRILFAGFYYHPKLVEFDVDLGLGLEQRFLDYDSAADRDIYGTNTEYRFGIDILKDQSYTFNLFATRREVRTRQNFFATNEALTESEGFAIYAKEWWIPSTLTYRQYRFRGRRGFEYFEDSSSWRLEGNRSGALGSFNYAAEIIDFEQFASSDSIQDRRFNATYRRAGGLDGRNAWRSFFSAADRDGDSGYTRLLLDNSYRHYWSRNFSGDARLNVARTDRLDRRTDTFTLNGGLRHVLFSSLVSSASAGWSHSDFGEGSSDVLSQNGSLAYRKEVPFGAVRAGQSLGLSTQSRESFGGSLVVVDEPHVYTLGTPLLLDNPNVDPASVTVRDSAGLVVYTEGIDYFLVQVGAFTRIDIPVSSLISPGDTILVDYEFQQSPARRAQTVTSTSTAGVQVGDVADLGLTYQTTDSRVLSGVDDGTLEDTRRINALLQTFPAQNLVVGAEYEDYVSQQSPFVRYRAFTSWSRTLGTRSSFTTGADAYRLEVDSVGDESGASARATLATRVSAQATTTLSAQYQRRSLVVDDAEGYLLEASYRQRFGRATLQASVQWVREDFRIGTDQEVLRLEVVFTRSF